MRCEVANFAQRVNVNTNNVAVGYSVGASAEESLVYGGEISGNITVSTFLLIVITVGTIMFMPVGK